MDQIQRLFLLCFLSKMCFWTNFGESDGKRNWPKCTFRVSSAHRSSVDPKSDLDGIFLDRWIFFEWINVWFISNFQSDNHSENNDCIASAGLILLFSSLWKIYQVPFFFDAIRSVQTLTCSSSGRFIWFQYLRYIHTTMGISWFKRWFCSIWLGHVLVVFLLFLSFSLNGYL